VTTTELEAPGSSQQSAGTALAGTASASADAHVFQLNVQVDAGFGPGAADSDQTASNIAIVDLTSVALSGDATASAGGSATTGEARAIQSAFVMQMNIQIIAGYVPEGGVDQEASNLAIIDGTSIAASGDATAAGAGSSAASGDATAEGSTLLQQRNVQIYVGNPATATGGAVSMRAANEARLGNTTVAASGGAIAGSGGTASSGRAAAASVTSLVQENFDFYR
jgi:hypothetical protein